MLTSVPSFTFRIAGQHRRHLLAAHGGVGTEGAVIIALHNAQLRRPGHRRGTVAVRRHIGKLRRRLHGGAAGHTVQHRHQHPPVHGRVRVEPAVAGALEPAPLHGGHHRVVTPHLRRNIGKASSRRFRVLGLVPTAAGAAAVVRAACFLGIVIGIKPNHFTVIPQPVLARAHLRQDAVHHVHPAGAAAVVKLRQAADLGHVAAADGILHPRRVQDRGQRLAGRGALRHRHRPGHQGGVVLFIALIRISAAAGCAVVGLDLYADPDPGGGAAPLLPDEGHGDRPVRAQLLLRDSQGAAGSLIAFTAHGIGVGAASQEEAPVTFRRAAGHRHLRAGGLHGEGHAAALPGCFRPLQGIEVAGIIVIVNGAVAVTDGGSGAPVGLLRCVQGGKGQGFAVILHHVHGAGGGVLGHIEVDSIPFRIGRGQQRGCLDTGAGVRERHPPQLRQRSSIRRHQAALGAVVHHAVVDDRRAGAVSGVLMPHAGKATEGAILRQLHGTEVAAVGGEIQRIPAADQGGAHISHVRQLHPVQTVAGAPVPGEQGRRAIAIGVGAVDHRVARHNGRCPVGAAGEIRLIRRPEGRFLLILRRRVLILRRQAEELRRGGVAGGAVHTAVPVDERRGALTAQGLADPQGR